ncbi:hypothetical protein B0H14DRAFT_2589633 [Mycena olivaceomarginata]|nr:hypothetical protein B0H14DRAFT_2589633 [Mycena olivaceomarginata]
MQNDPDEYIVDPETIFADVPSRMQLFEQLIPVELDKRSAEKTPTDEDIWRSIRHKDIGRKAHNFLWKALLQTFKCGSYWRNIPTYEMPTSLLPTRTARTPVLTVHADPLGDDTAVDPFAECAVRDVAGVVLPLLLPPMPPIATPPIPHTRAAAQEVERSAVRYGQNTMEPYFCKKFDKIPIQNPRKSDTYACGWRRQCLPSNGLLNDSLTPREVKSILHVAHNPDQPPFDF